MGYKRGQPCVSIEMMLEITSNRTMRKSGYCYCHITIAAQWDMSSSYPAMVYIVQEDASDHAAHQRLGSVSSY